MVNRAQRRKMRSMNRRGKGPQVQVREDGEVQLGVSVREGAVVMTLAAPDGQTMVLGVPPDSARQFAVALDDAVVDGLLPLHNPRPGAPTPDYARLYEWANRRLDDMAAQVVQYLEGRLYRAESIPANETL